VNLVPNLEKPKTLEEAAVFVDILPDPRNERGAQERLIARDRVENPNLIFRLELEQRGGFVADERVVVNFVESPRGDEFPEFVKEHALRVRRRNHGRQQRRRRLH
jgi:hypothetical protein